jgi:hypothetical protein
MSGDDYQPKEDLTVSLNPVLSSVNIELMSLKGKYAICGVGYTAQGRVPGRTALSFYQEAGANAVADAGLKPSDIDGLICYRYFSPGPGEFEPTPYRVASMLGIVPKYLSQEYT